MNGKLFDLEFFYHVFLICFVDLFATYFHLVLLGDKNENKLNHFDISHVPRIIMLGLDAWEKTQYGYKPSN